jgi:predicted nucleotidyltransferase component of viral defense system
MLDRARHDIVLKNILREIYQHPQLQAQLAFKGGTCLYLFHRLPRFSTDLDFTLLTEEADLAFDPQQVNDILSGYLTILEAREKHFTWFWQGSYEKGQQRVKVEISKRQNDDRLTTHDFLGVTVRSLDLASMFAHKLCTISDRPELVNRDLYDTWWMLKQMAPIRAEIILERTGKTVAEYLAYLLDYIPEHVDRRHILGGLGELFDQPQKDWVRGHLLDELLVQLRLRAEAEG